MNHLLIDSDKEKLLLSRLKNGKEDAFEELYRAYSPRVYSFVCSALFNKSLAEDITQSCFTKIWEKREELDTTKNFSSYLFTIARNLVYRESERQVMDARYLDFMKKLNSDHSDEIENSVHFKFMLHRIYDLIEELPAVRRQIFIMSRIQGYSNREIANKLSLSERTVESQIYRTLLFLKEKMKGFLLFLSITGVL